MKCPSRQSRAGFTLVEMLVAMILILTLATLAVAILPSIGDKRAVARGADQLQGWLVQARSRAMRDQAPRGLRLACTINAGQISVSQIEYVEQPANYVPRDVNGAVGFCRFSPGMTTAFGTATISGQFGTSFTDSIRVGDLIEVMDGENAGIYRIVGTTPANVPIQAGTSMQVVPNFTAASTTTNYRIIRRWRPLLGEPMLEMPKGVIVDVSMTDNLGRPLPTLPNPRGTYVGAAGRAEIILMFGPNGQLLDAPSGRAILWVRHEENKGEPSLITIYTRSGAVAAHPVDTESGNPFSFTEDGFGSGL